MVFLPLPTTCALQTLVGVTLYSSNSVRLWNGFWPKLTATCLKSSRLAETRRPRPRRQGSHLASPPAL
eukprot:1264085-Pyramimonas_sp.AAC.1